MPTILSTGLRIMKKRPSATIAAPTPIIASIAGLPYVDMHDRRHMRLCRGVDLEFAVKFTPGKATGTLALSVYGAWDRVDNDGRNPVAHRMEILGTLGSVTFGATTGANDPQLSAEYFFINGFVWTRSTASGSPYGPMESIESRYGGSVAGGGFLPVANGSQIARLTLPDVGLANQVVVIPTTLTDIAELVIFANPTL